MSIAKITVKPEDMPIRRAELNTTTFERSLIGDKTGLAKLAARTWIAVFGTLGNKGLKGADTFKQERAAIKNYQSRLKDLVSYMPSAVSDDNLASLLNISPEKNISGARFGDACALKNEKLPAFYIALQSRVQLLEHCYPKDYSPEKQAELLQAGEEDLRAKMQEHHDTWYKFSKISPSWNTRLTHVLADQSVKTVGHSVSSSDIRDHGERMLEKAYGLHVKTFGLEDGEETSRLEENIRRTISKERGEECRSSARSLTSTAGHKARVGKEIATLNDEIRRLENEMEGAIQLRTEWDAQKATCEQEMRQIRTEMDQIDPQDKLHIETHMEKEFSPAELRYLHSALGVGKEVFLPVGLSYLDAENQAEPAELIAWCRNKPKEMLWRIETLVPFLEQFSSDQEALPLLQKLKDMVGKQWWHMEKVDETATKKSRKQAAADKIELGKKLDKLQKDLNHIDRQIDREQRKIDGLQKLIGPHQDIRSKKQDEFIRLKHMDKQAPDTAQSSMLGYLSETRRSAMHAEIAALSAQNESLINDTIQAEHLIEKQTNAINALQKDIIAEKSAIEKFKVPLPSREQIEKLLGKKDITEEDLYSYQKAWVAGEKMKMHPPGRIPALEKIIDELNHAIEEQEKIIADLRDKIEKNSGRIDQLQMDLQRILPEAQQLENLFIFSSRNTNLLKGNFSPYVDHPVIDEMNDEAEALELEPIDVNQERLITVEELSQIGDGESLNPTGANQPEDPTDPIDIEDADDEEGFVEPSEPYVEPYVDVVAKYPPPPSFDAPDFEATVVDLPETGSRKTTASTWMSLLQNTFPFIAG